MSELEDLNEFENDAGHYLANLDRALVQLQRILVSESSSDFYFEAQSVSQGIKKLGRQMTEYVQEKRKTIFEDIDKEAGRVRAGLEGAASGQGNFKDTQRIHTSAGTVPTSRL